MLFSIVVSIDLWLVLRLMNKFPDSKGEKKNDYLIWIWCICIQAKSAYEKYSRICENIFPAYSVRNELRKVQWNYEIVNLPASS